jgi:hypothetical protein
MTQILQSGQHPDADQLNAFVERALTPHEQQQMLAHLAICPDCRAIAYLAQPAVVEEAGLPRTVAARKPWFSGWNLALPAALAVAFLVILTVHLRNVGTAKPDAEVVKTMRLEQTPSLPQMSSSTAQAVAPKPVPAPIQKPAFSANAIAASSSSSTAPVHGAPPQVNSGESLAGRSTNTRLSPDSGVAYDAVHGGLPRQTVSGGSLISASSAQAAASPANVMPSGTAQTAGISNVDSVHRELRSSLAQYNSATVTAQSGLNQAFQAAPTAPPPPEAPRSENETVSVSSAAAMLDTESTQSSQLVAGNATASLAQPAFKMKKQPSLPSHLPALSTISNARQELVIDSAGSLFRSEDAGVTWQPIPPQWTGRAVKLQLSPLQTLAKSTNPAASTATAKSAPTAPAQPIFELTNDAGYIWISTDGQTWKRR